MRVCNRCHRADGKINGSLFVGAVRPGYMNASDGVFRRDCDLCGDCIKIVGEAAIAAMDNTPSVPPTYVLKPRRSLWMTLFSLACQAASGAIGAVVYWGIYEIVKAHH